MEAMEINHSTNSPLQSEALDPGAYNLSAGTGVGLEVGSWNGCYAWQYLKIMLSKVYLAVVISLKFILKN